MSEFYDDFEDDLEIDAEDEAVTKEDKVKKQKMSFDLMLTIFGICLAGSAAFLPWYVFLNQDEFSVKRMAYSDDRVLPDWEGRTVVNVSPQAIKKRNPEIDTQLPPDEITTASIQSPGDSLTGSAAKQEFPGGKLNYRLLHVVNERALIEDDSGMYMVKVGSVLPDNSTLAELEQREGKWAIVTSNGDVLVN